MEFLDEIKAQIAALKPTSKELRNLGLLFCGVAFVLAGLFYWRERTYWPWLVGIGLLFAIWGLAWPAGLKPVHKFWMGLAAVLGYFVSRLLLIVVFYLVITPIGWIIRLMGKDLLDLKAKQEESYWRAKSASAYEPRQTEKMY